MASLYWLDASGDYSSASNYAGATGPAANGDSLYIMSGSKSIVTNLPAAGSGINYSTLAIGKDFSGTIGAAATPLQIGTSAVEYDGARCTEAFFKVDTGDTSTLQCFTSSGATYGLALGVTGTGKWSDVNIHTAGMIRIMALCEVTTLRTLGDNPDKTVYIESGHIVGTIAHNSGLMQNYGVGTTVNVTGKNAIYEALGTSTYNHTALNLFSGITRFSSIAGTWTTVNLYGDAVLDLERGNNPRTITTLNQFGGTVLKRGAGGRAVTIGTHNKTGGVVIEY